LPDTICNTSPLQYLYQIGRLEILKELAGELLVPTAVWDELEAGRRAGVDLPDLTKLSWVKIHPAPKSERNLGGSDLGPGEAGVLALALSKPGSRVILDDAKARRIATQHDLPLTGTLGLLLDAKKAGMLVRVQTALDELQDRGFRLAPKTRAAVLQLAAEEG